ncbi:MAG: hypothetical protein KAI62_05940, partial [Actinomycetia bacterium]|nr:hypothetical protein [Actinomycetes bacterium]
MPDTAGNYNITVAVDDGNGGHAEKTETVEVLSLPTSNVPQVFGGWIEEGPTAIGIGMSALVGDSTHDKSFRGFLSFDISSLSGKTITSAIIKFENFYVTGDPDFIEKIWLESVDWGTNFQGNDYNIPGVLLGEYDPPTFTCSNDDL